MMNAKSKIKVFQTKGIIEINTTFVKMMQDPLSDEYALLQKTRMENPTFAVRRRQINTNPKKDTYKGLTYDYMEYYISTHEPEDKVDEVLAYFEELKLISQCHGKRLRYPTIKKWFLNQYPDVAKFGLEPLFVEEVTDAAEDTATNGAEEAATQGAIPFNPVAADSATEGLAETA